MAPTSRGADDFAAKGKLAGAAAAAFTAMLALALALGAPGGLKVGSAAIAAAGGVITFGFYVREPYLTRDIDGELEEALEGARRPEGVTMVLLDGPSNLSRGSRGACSRR